MPIAPAAVLWDMDGTLVDTEPSGSRPRPPWSPASAAPGRTSRRSRSSAADSRDAPRVLQEHGVELAVRRRSSTTLTDHVAERCGCHVPWRPGALELLAELRDAGVPTALVTMSMRRMAEAVAAAIPFPAFDVIVSGRRRRASEAPPGPVPAGRRAARRRHRATRRHRGLAARARLGRRLRRRRDRRAAHRRRCRTGPPGASGRRSPAARVAGPRPSVLARRELTAAAHDRRLRARRPRAADRPQGPPQHDHAAARRRSSTPTAARSPTTSCSGSPTASVVTGSDGTIYLALKPLLTDYVMSMPRGAAIVYPKDAGQILAAGDIAQGRRVVEAGVGSGALSLWLLRAVGPSGRAALRRAPRTSSPRSRADNVAGFFGERPDRWSLTVGDLVDVLDAGEADAADRVVLDMLAPWECVPAVSRALAPGGVVLAYVATVPQLSRFVEALRDDRRLHRAARRPRRWCAAGTSTASPCAPTTGWSPTRASSSPPAGSRRGADRAPHAQRRAPKDVRRRGRRDLDARRPRGAGAEPEAAAQAQAGARQATRDRRRPQRGARAEKPRRR